MIHNVSGEKIWFETIRVILNSAERAARVLYEITSMISDQKLHSCHFNYHFITVIMKSQNSLSTYILLVQ